jgi:hypothetical protein
MTYWVKTDESYKYGIVKWLHSLIQCNAEREVQQTIIITTSTHSFAAVTTSPHPLGCPPPPLLSKPSLWLKMKVAGSSKTLVITYMSEPKTTTIWTQNIHHCENM